MKHFSDEEWLNFVRDVLPRPRRVAMDGHLRSKCPECLRSHGLWESVRDVALRQPATEVPPGVREAEETIFKTWRRLALVAQARRAQPIYDSLLVPLPAGVRATGLTSRHVIHRWYQWSVDLRIDTEPSNRLSLVGQVLRPGWRPKNDSKTGIFLMSRDIVLQETGMNQFGEFQFAVQRVPDLTIVIELSQQHSIALTLPLDDQPLTLKRRGSDLRT
jgi:hypothetical protein